MNDTENTQHWAVTVKRNGEKVVTLESNSQSGRNLSDEDKRIIRVCAEHLLSFITVPFVVEQP